MRNRPRNHDDRALRILVGGFLTLGSVALVVLGAVGLNHAHSLALNHTPDTGAPFIAVVAIMIGCAGALIGAAIVKEGC